jgi:hypothetical protein
MQGEAEIRPMSSSNPEENTNPERNMARAESEHLNRLEAIAQHGLETYVEVGDSLAEIRDRRLYRVSHSSFETYIRERWGVNILRHDAGATRAGEHTGEELLPMLRWRVSQAIGTIAEVAHLLESRASDVDDGARNHLRDDILVLDDELETLTALLAEPVDWDSGFTRLLEGELPPLDAAADPDDDD